MENQDVLQAILSELKEIKNIQKLQSDDLSDIKQRVVKMEVAQENVTNKNIQLLLEGQQGMNEKFAKLNQVAKDVEEIKVSALEEVSKSQELRMVK